ncbi:MAG: PilZ domain-containing protein [Gammaproteobacteria bacterium]|nr:PilZ domain-containing protein [Gammaproteobacteria bacterium]
MNEKRRDHRIEVDLPFLVKETDGSKTWQGKTLDISPTGILLKIDEQPPESGAIVNVSVQGPAESGWEHINTRPMRVVRSDEHLAGLTYTDLDKV